MCFSHELTARLRRAVSPNSYQSQYEAQFEAQFEFEFEFRPYTKSTRVAAVGVSEAGRNVSVLPKITPYPSGDKTGVKS